MWVHLDSHDVETTLNSSPDTTNVDALINNRKSWQNSEECIQGSGPEQPRKHGEWNTQLKDISPVL